MKKTVVLAIATLTLSGCASHQDSIKQSTLQSELKKESYGSIYAKLEQTPNGYEFTSYTLGYVPDEGPWVSIRNDKPLWDTRTEMCITGLAKKELQCSSADEKLFRVDAGMDAGQAGGWAFMTTLTFGLQATMPPARVVFDEQSFEKSYAEAYEKLLKEIEYNPKLRILEADANISQIEELKEIIHSNIEIANNTGFEFPSLDSNDIGVSTEYRHMKKEYHDTKKLISYLDSLSLAATSGGNFERVLLVSCPPSISSYFDTEIKCGNMEINSTKGHFEIPVSIEVLSKKDLYLYPKNLLARDSAIDIEINGRDVVFLNKSDSYLYLKNFSFYHNDKIYTKTWTSPETIPPEAQKQFQLSSLIPFARGKIAYLKSAKSAHQPVEIDYRLATSYELDGEQKSITGKKKYMRISDLISLAY
jgi:hypothetical protein